MTVNADMRIGEFQETLVVTGDSPVVDDPQRVEHTGRSGGGLRQPAVGP